MQVDTEIRKFRLIKAFTGDHNFWEELGGYNRIAIADQSVVRRDGSFYSPDQADNGLLFVDFHTICEKKYVLEYTKTPLKSIGYYLPVVDVYGEKFTTLLSKREHDWFMEKFGGKKSGD
jgi:hypothetical protein